jgi:hypothetical protein
MRKAVTSVTHSKVESGEGHKGRQTQLKGHTHHLPRQKQDASKKRMVQEKFGNVVRDRYKVTNGSGVGAPDGNKINHQLNSYTK